jgi:hypothetical protein
LYLQQHFYDLNGRVFQPYGEDREMYFAYARPRKNLEGTQQQYDELEKYFIIEKCSMGKDPQEALKTKMESELSAPLTTPQWLTLHYLERNPDGGIMVGYYRSEEHLKWIMGNNDKGSLVYNVRLQLRGEEPREGAHSADFYKKQNVQFVVLYTDGVEKTGAYHVFHVKDTASKVTEERMKGTWYPFEVKGPHFFFRFDEEITLGKLNIVGLLNALKAKHLTENGSFIPGEPLFATAKEVLNYRIGF